MLSTGGAGSLTGVRSTVNRNNVTPARCLSLPCSAGPRSVRPDLDVLEVYSPAGLFDYPSCVRSLEFVARRVIVVVGYIISISLCRPIAKPRTRNSILCVGYSYAIRKHGIKSVIVPACLYAKYLHADKAGEQLIFAKDGE